MTDNKNNILENEKVLDNIKKSHEKKSKREDLQETIAFIIIVCIFVSGFLYIVYRIYAKCSENLEYLNNLNKTVVQISQLVDSIRLVQTIHGNERTVSLERLINEGAIPDVLLKKVGGKLQLVNPFGGNIFIEPSSPLKSDDKSIETPTFKIGYQGLSHRVCVDLAIMDWGDKLKGLQAVAVGSIDPYTGEDTALSSIDCEVNKSAWKEVVDKNGRKRRVVPRMRMNMNVAKPNDDKLSTPFPEDVADMACSCYRDNSCSFALLYSVFSVDKSK